MYVSLLFTQFYTPLILSTRDQSVCLSKYMESIKEALMAMEEPRNEEMVLLNEDVWLKEEEISDMIESLIIGDAHLNENNEVQVNCPFAGPDHSCLGNRYWWEAYALASGADNYTEYNWCFEDDMKMWEWSEYSYTTLEIPRRFEMPGLIECKDASEALAN